MSPGRFKSAYNGLTAIARRVYDAAPISEDWNASVIQTELIRLGLPIREYRVLEGILNSLTQVGLLEEPRKGCFRRTKIAPLKAKAIKPEPQQQPQEPNAAIMSTPIKPITDENGAIDKLAAIAARAKELSEQIKALSNDIENAALDIEEEFAASTKDLEKLRTLRVLMKDL